MIDNNHEDIDDCIQNQPRDKHYNRSTIRPHLLDHRTHIRRRFTISYLHQWPPFVIPTILMLLLHIITIVHSGRRPLSSFRPIIIQLEKGQQITDFTHYQ